MNVHFYVRDGVGMKFWCSVSEGENQIEVFRNGDELLGFLLDNDPQLCGFLELNAVDAKEVNKILKSESVCCACIPLRDEYRTQIPLQET